MKGWLRFLIFLGLTVLGICGLVYFRREMLVLLKGMLGFIAILVIALAAISFWEGVRRSE